MESGKFDPSHSGELLKFELLLILMFLLNGHMDQQNEVLMEAYRSMLHELQKLQVEEEMLMHKLYEVMSAHGLTKMSDGNSNAAYNSGAENPNNEVNEAHEEQ